MSHQGTEFASKKDVLADVLKRDIKQVGRFSAQSTAEEVANVLASDITGKIVIITGASPSGIGAEAARVIFQHDPKLLILASRSLKAIDETIIAIGGQKSSENVRAVQLDLSDLESVRRAAAEILELTPTVDVLINNAGIMMAPEFKTTKQGFETQWQVNHLGHFLFTNLLLPALLKSSFGASVVNISSAGHRASGVHLDDINFNDGKSYDPFVAYGQSKSAQILFTVSLDQKLRKKGLRSFAVDPGSVGTTNLSKTIPFEKRVELGWWNADGSLGDTIPWHSVGIGASSYIVGAFDRSIDDQSGKCLAYANVDPTTELHATDPEIAEKVWTLSEKHVGQEFRYA